MRHKPKPGEYFFVNEAARILGCAHVTLHRAIRAKKVPALRVRGRGVPVYVVRWGDVRGFRPRPYRRH